MAIGELVGLRMMQAGETHDWAVDAMDAVSAEVAAALSVSHGLATSHVRLKGPDHGGCGRLTVVAAPVEDLLIDAVLTRLDSPQLAEVLAGKSTTSADVAALSARLDTDTARLDELASLYAEGAVSAREWITARDPITARIHDTRRQIATATDTGELHELAGTGQQLRDRWDDPDLDLDRQHAIIKSILDHAVIAPGTPGSRSLDINRVLPQWRV